MKKFIGDKAFYKNLLGVVLPIVLQQFITQFVGLLDNLMVGQVGNDEMTGVSLANQLLFVFSLAVFGSMSGASIFASQYFGANDKRGYQETVRFKWLLGIIIFVISFLVLFFFNEQLLSIFIKSQEGEHTNPIVVLSSAKEYLMIMLIGLLPFIIKDIYASSLREMQETLVPMIAGVIAIFVNLILNYLLIFGKFGFPTLGIVGAAIATVISRFVEMGIVVIYLHLNYKRFDFFKHIYNNPFVSKTSIKKFLPKTLLFMTNELLWSLGMTFILASYAIRGLDVVASFNICNTVSNLFLTIGTSVGNATAIIIGAMLGSMNEKQAKESSYRIMAFSVFFSLFFLALMILSAYLIPNIFNTSKEIKECSKDLIIIGALFLPSQVFNTCCYFILRSGGKIVLTMLFDSLYIMLIRLPVTFIMCKYSQFTILIIFLIINILEFIKTFVGYILVDKGIWINKII